MNLQKYKKEIFLSRIYKYFYGCSVTGYFSDTHSMMSFSRYSLMT